MDDNSEINIYNPNNKDDFYPFGIVLANAIKKVNDSCITGDNYHRSVEALELLMGGREDEIYEDEIYMLNSKHNILESNNKISIKERQGLYYDEKFRIINALVHRSTRGVLRVKEYLTQSELVRLVVKNIKKDNQGQIIAITGAQGTGKSYDGIALSKEVVKYTLPKRKFSLDNVAFTTQEFFRIYNNKDLTPEGDYILFEEIGVNANAKDALTSINKVLGKISQTLRYRKLIIILTAPDLSFIDKTLRKQMHFWLETDKKFSKKKGYSTVKPFIVKNIQRTGDLHFIYPKNTDGNQVRELRIPELDESLAEEYERKQKYYKDNLSREAEQEIGALQERNIMKNKSLRNDPEFLRYCELKDKGMKTKNIIENSLIEKSQPTLSKWEKLRKKIKYESVEDGISKN